MRRQASLEKNKLVSLGELDIYRYYACAPMRKNRLWGKEPPGAAFEIWETLIQEYVASLCWQGSQDDMHRT